MYPLNDFSSRSQQLIIERNEWSKRIHFIENFLTAFAFYQKKEDNIFSGYGCG